MTIKQTKTTDEATLYSPLADFESQNREIEVREDPLTGRPTRIVEAIFPAPEETPTIEDYVSDAEGCFFCPEMVTEATPEYPDFVGEDRIERGDAISFPNLFPYGKHSNVVVLTDEHFQPIDAFETSTFEDGFGCALEFLGAVVDHDAPEFASINMNFLPSAGSSVVHPHVQTLADDYGTTAQRRRAQAERAHHEEHGTTYWKDVRETEVPGPRHVGSTGTIEWLAPFAPVHHWHVRGVTDTVGLPAPDDDTVAELADGITNVLEYYASLDLNAYNFAISFPSADPQSPAVVDVVARSPFDDNYITDVSFLGMIHGESVVDVAPEVYADEVADYF